MDRISDSQIAEIAKLPVKRCNETKLELVRMGLLKQRGGMFGPNKNISEWCIPQNRGISLKSGDKKSLNLGDSNPSKQGDTKDTITKDKKDNNSTSENSDESSDKPPKNLPDLRPDAAIQSAKGNKWGTSEDLKAAEFMYSKVVSVMPAAKQPSWESWANDIRLMRNALNVDHQEICRVFKWANLDSFWQSNVMCPAKLREKWDTLNIQMAQWMKKRQQQVTAKAEPHWNSKESWEDVI